MNLLKMFLRKHFELGQFFLIFFNPKRLPETALHYAPIDFLMKWVDLGIFLKENTYKEG